MGLDDDYDADDDIKGFPFLTKLAPWDVFDSKGVNMSASKTMSQLPLRLTKISFCLCVLFTSNFFFSLRPFGLWH